MGNHRANVPGDHRVGKCVLDLHASRETGLAPFRVPLVFFRYEGTVLFWWSRKLTYTSCDSHACTRANKPMPQVKYLLLVPYADKAERSCSSGTQIGASKILISTCGSDTSLTSKKLPSMSTLCSEMATAVFLERNVRMH